MPKKNLTLYCFSPFIMLATFAIELALAAAVWWQYRATHLQRLVIFILICLGTFQAAEYAICEGGDKMLWAKLGMVAITLLPPLGVHLMGALTQNYRFVKLSYALAALYIIAFAFVSGVTQGAQCTGNYVIVDLVPTTNFGLYYFVFLLVALGKAYAWLTNPTTLKSNRRPAIAWLSMGYLSFMAPTVAAYLILPSVQQAVPSVMCGFAVILAFILAGGVAPHLAEIEKNKD